MKKVLLVALTLLASGAASHVQAADMPVKAPPPKVVVEDPWTWAGFYVGGNIGYSWGQSDTDFNLYNANTGALLVTDKSKFDMDGWVGGLQLGYNFQTNNWVYGVEGDWQWTGQKGNTTFYCPGAVCAAGATAFPIATASPTEITFSQKLEWLATLRGRLGTTVFGPSTIVYVTGGAAWGHIKTEGTLTGYINAAPPNNLVTTAFTNSTTRFGWVIGGGVETRLMGNWTGKLEYIYVDLGTLDLSTINGTTGILVPLNAQFSSRLTDNILRAGLNYKF